MSASSIFQLISNDGKQDLIYLSPALQNLKLKQVNRIRAQNNNIQNPTPLINIERTHISNLKR